MLESLPVMNYKSIAEVFPTSTPEALDVIKSCLHFNPDRRPSAEELLRHTFVGEFHNEEVCCCYRLVSFYLYYLSCQCIQLSFHHRWLFVDLLAASLLSFLY